MRFALAGAAHDRAIAIRSTQKRKEGRRRKDIREALRERARSALARDSTDLGWRDGLIVRDRAEVPIEVLAPPGRPSGSRSRHPAPSRLGCRSIDGLLCN